MAIVGDHPETGVRFVLERPGRAEAESGAPSGSERPVDGGAPWIYRGDAFTPDARFALEVGVSRAGEVQVDGGDTLPADIAEKVRLLFRTLFRQAKDTPSGETPRKVVRWRGEK
jgi:hypothetical protein